MKTVFGALAFLAFALTPAAAEDGAHAHPSLEASDAVQGDAIADLITRSDANEAAAVTADGKAEAAIVKNSAQDGRIDAIEAGIAAVSAEIDALKIETEGLRDLFDGLDARVTALEGATPPPEPNPDLPVISIDVAPQSADEGASFTFSLTRTGDLSADSSVAYAAFGEADAADFIGGVIASGVVSFAPGDDVANFTIATNDDVAVESDEGFGVALSNPVGADIGRAAAQATIVNNDQAVPPPPPPPPPPSNGAVMPDTSDGLPITILGLGFYNDWQAESPYKNFFLLEPPGGGGKRIADGASDQITGWVCLKPGEVLSGRPVRRTQQDGFDIDPGPWVVAVSLKDNPDGTPGTASVKVNGFSNTSTDPKTIRLVGDLTGATDGRTIDYSGGPNGGCFRGDFWGPVKYENDPNGLNPSFIQYVSQYKIFRPMDWSAVGGSKQTLASQQLPDSAYVKQYSSDGGWPTDATYPGSDKLLAGFQFGLYFDIAKQTGAAPWINIPATLGGDSVRKELWAAKDPASFEAMKAAIAANIDTILADAEIEYRKLADMLATSALTNGHPDNVAIILELHNELWNYGTPTFKRGAEYVSGIARGLNYKNEYHNYGQGVIEALMVRAFKERFAAIKPNQELVFVMGFQTGAFDVKPDGSVSGIGLARAKGAVAGFKWYEQTRGVAQSNLIDVFAGSTGYYSGAITWNPNKSPGKGNPFGAATEAEFIAAWSASHSADPAAHRLVLRDFLATKNVYVTVPNMVDRNRAIRDFAVANGMAGVIQYEGGTHDVLDSSGAHLGAVYPAAKQGAFDFSRSLEGRQTQEAAITLLRQINPTNPARTHGWRPAELPMANYQSVRVTFDASKPWAEIRADELGPCANDNSIAGAWCNNLRDAR